MISNDARGDTTVLVLASGEKADTAAATSGWIDCRSYKGNIAVTLITGARTGSMAGKLKTATDSEGAGAADIVGATFTNVTADDKAQTIYIPATSVKFLQFVGTVTTGPIILGVALQAHPGVV